MPDQAQMLPILFALNIALSVVAFLFGWLVKSLFDRIGALEQADIKMIEQVALLREALPTHYTRQDRFDKTIDNIFALLRDIQAKLDHKADRP